MRGSGSRAPDWITPRGRHAGTGIAEVSGANVVSPEESASDVGLTTVGISVLTKRGSQMRRARANVLWRIADSPTCSPGLQKARLCWAIPWRLTETSHLHSVASVGTSIRDRHSRRAHFRIREAPRRVDCRAWTTVPSGGRPCVFGREGALCSGQGIRRRRLPSTADNRIIRTRPSALGRLRDSCRRVRSSIGSSNRPRESASQRIGLQLQQTSLIVNATPQSSRRQNATQIENARLSVVSYEPIQPELDSARRKNFSWCYLYVWRAMSALPTLWRGK